MRSSARTLLTVLALAAGVLGVVLTAQSAEKLYADLMAQEAGLRKELDVTPSHDSQPSEEASADLIRRVRTTVASYEDAARQFPRSGYSDNALWQAAVLSADAFWQFGDDRDRAEGDGERRGEQVADRFAEHGPPGRRGSRAPLALVLAP